MYHVHSSVDSISKLAVSIYLTCTTLLASLADDKLMIFFL